MLSHLTETVKSWNGSVQPSNHNVLTPFLIFSTFMSVKKGIVFLGQAVVAEDTGHKLTTQVMFKWTDSAFLWNIIVGSFVASIETSWIQSMFQLMSKATWLSNPCVLGTVRIKAALVFPPVCSDVCLSALMCIIKLRSSSARSHFNSDL